MTQTHCRGGGGCAAQPSAAGDKDTCPGLCQHNGGVLGLVQAAPGSERGVTPVWLAKQGVPSLEGVAKPICPPGALA